MALPLKTIAWRIRRGQGRVYGSVDALMRALKRRAIRGANDNNSGKQDQGEVMNVFHASHFSALQ